MSTPTIYTLPFRPGNNFSDYQRSLKKALFSQSRILQISWTLSSQDFFQLFVKEVRSTPLKIAIRCSPSEVSKVLERLDGSYELHIYFSHSSQLSEEIETLKKISKPHKFILSANRSSDFNDIAEAFTKSNLGNLYFYFATFSDIDPASLRTREVAKIIKSWQKKFPQLPVSPLPGLELYDQNISEFYDLEPLMKDAPFETKVNDSDIKYSFIIPTFNSKFFLANVLTHIFKQNIAPQFFEVIVVDDGGTDGTLPYIKSYLQNENIQGNLRYFYWSKPTPKPNEKPIFRAGLCRNLGANNARGDYLVFLDSDILVPANFLIDLQSCLKSHDVIQYVRHHIRPEKSNAYVSAEQLNSNLDLYIEEESYWGPYFSHPNWSNMDFYWKYTCTYCLALKKNDFYGVGRFRRSFVSYGFEDTDLGYRLHKMGLRFHLSKLVTLHLTPPANAMNSGGSDYKRFLALSKTAKIFFLSNLDINIYSHFTNYMGGERDLFKESAQLFGRFLRMFSKEEKKSEALTR